MLYPPSQLWRGTIRLYRWPLLVVIVLFGLGFVLGIVLPLSIKLILLDAIGVKFEGIITAAAPWQLAWNIFENNLIVALILYVLGFTVALPALVVVSNGVVMGVVIALFYRLDAMMPGEFLRSMLLLLPHGIFELSAFALASVLSVMVVLKAVLHQHIEPTKSRRRVLLDSVLRFSFVIMPLLVVASVVETFVSQPVADGIVDHWITPVQSENTLVQLNTAALAAKHCTPGLHTIGNTDVGLASSLTTVAKIVYQPQIYNLLRQRRATPSEQQSFTCADNITITLSAWPSSQWSLEQARALQLRILEVAETEQWTELEPNRFVGATGSVELVSLGDATITALFSDASWRLADLTE